MYVRAENKSEEKTKITNEWMNALDTFFLSFQNNNDAVVVGRQMKWKRERERERERETGTDDNKTKTGGDGGGRGDDNIWYEEGVEEEEANNETTIKYQKQTKMRKRETSGSSSRQ